MKKILAFGLLFCLLFNIVLADSDTISIVNGKIIGEEIRDKTIWELFTSSQPFTFVSETATSANQVCKRYTTSGELSHLGGDTTLSGSKCSVGQYIAFVSVEDGSYLFDKLWYKSNSDDLVDFRNYYLNQKAFRYYYVCYNCESASTTNDEEGCLSKDKTDCVQKSNSNCGTDYVYEKVCLTKISSVSGSSGSGSSSTTTTTSTSPKITFGDIKVSNNGEITQGAVFEIKGMAYIQGEVKDAVIETGYISDYFMPLTISGSANQVGACGDDKTTGFKFSGKDEWLVFSLKLKAEELGAQRLKIISSLGCGKGIHSYKTIDLNVKAPEQPLPEEPIITEPNCDNEPNSIACTPAPCTGSECDLIPCDVGNCTGGSGVYTDPTKDKPNQWFTTENIVIGSLGLLILIAMTIGLSRKRKK